MAALIYTVILLMALIIVLPFHSAVSGQAGNSMALHSLLKQFNYTIYTDFMHSAGKIINPLLYTAVWMGIFYFLVTVFFSGGILSSLSKKDGKFSAANFLAVSGEYFFRFLRLGIYLLIIIFFIAIAIFLPLGKILSSNYDTTQSEASLFYISIAGAFVFAIFFLLILLIGDYAKIILFNTDSRKVIRTIGKSVKFVFRHLFGTYCLYLLILLVLILSFIIYFVLENVIGMVSGITIFIVFLIQQAFIWLRILIKIWFLGSEVSFYNNMNQSEYQKVSIDETSNDSSSGSVNDMIENPEVS
jgi:hypothetical protein